MLRVRVVETQTGRVLSPPLEPASVSYNRLLAGMGDGEIVFTASTLASHDIQPWLQAQAVTYVVEDDGHALFAGYLEDFLWNQETLTVRVSEVGRLLAVRPLNGAGADKLATRVYEGDSLRDVVIMMLRQALDHESERSWQMPIRWPSAKSGTRVVRSFEWYRFQTGQDVFDELMAEDGAPVVDFRPEWVDGKFSWEAVVGVLNHKLIQLMVGSSEHPVQGVTRVEFGRDFRARRTEMFVTGNGQEEKIVWSWADRGDVKDRFGGPRLVGISAWGTVEDPRRARQIAKGLLRSRSDSAEQWQIGINFGDLVEGWSVRPGDRLEIAYPGDAVIPRGTYERVVMGIQRTSQHEATITVQEVPTMVDRLNSGIDAVLRRLKTAESQASNRSSTTIEKIEGMVARVERSTATAQKAADAAKARADAARAEAERAKRDAANAQRSANSAKSAADGARSAAASARSRADSAYRYAGSAQGSADSARSAAASARSAASSAASSASRAHGRMDWAANNLNSLQLSLGVGRWSAAQLQSALLKVVQTINRW